MFKLYSFQITYRFHDKTIIACTELKIKPRTNVHVNNWIYSKLCQCHDLEISMFCDNRMNAHQKSLLIINMK